jgi:hypothetical protein
MESDHYISEQLTKAVLHLVSGIGGVKERLGAVYTHRISVIAEPRHRFPSSLQDRFDAIMERLRGFVHLRARNEITSSCPNYETQML